MILQQTVNEQIQNKPSFANDPVTCFKSSFRHTRDLEQERVNIGNHAAQ